MATGLQKSYELALQERVLSYWSNLIPEGADLPREDNIDQSDLQDIWESCFLIQTLDIQRGHVHNYTILGSDANHPFGAEESDYESPLLGASNTERLLRQYQTVTTSCKPLVCESTFASCREEVVDYREMLLPFSLDGHTVSSILGVIRYHLRPIEELS